MVAAAARAPAREITRAKHYRRPCDDEAWKRPQHAINREFMEDGGGFLPAALLRSGFEFLELNRTADDWFLMLECFDPHEPFHAPERFKNQYRTGWNGGVLDWPLLREGHRQPGGDRRDPRQLRGAGRHVRPLLRPAARLFRRARPLEGHGAHPVDRPRLPARRARLVGQEPDALLRRDLAHPAASSIIRRTRARAASGATR